MRPSFELRLDLTYDDAQLIAAIADRAEQEIFAPRNINQRVGDTEMDLSIVHCNGCPLKLQELLQAPPGDFAHDVCGILRHIGRRYGNLRGSFWPRYAK